jgi:FtsH-binding integral membrane protein
MQIAYRSATEVNSAMVRVYNHMFLAVVNSMIVSLLIASSPALMQMLFTGWMKWVVIFAPLVAVFAISAGIDRMTKSQAVITLHGFAALMGLSLSAIFVVFTMTSIVSAFMAAAVLFATMSIYGYFTKKDLSSWGSMLMVGLIAVVIASVINVFLAHSVFQMVISAVAVIVFLGLTAYDTQNIRQMVSIETTDQKFEVISALSLYLNFINLFTSLLQLFGARNDD